MIHQVRRYTILFRIVFGFVLLTSGLAVADNNTLSKTIKRIKPSIIAVATYLPTRRPRQRLLGTGFVVGNGQYVITNDHVIPKKMNTEKKERLVLYSGRGRNVQMIEVTELASDLTHDLSLLVMKNKILPAFKLGDTTTVEEGCDIAFTGFPITSVLGIFPVTHRGIVSSITPNVIPFSASSQLTPALIKILRDPYGVFQLDATAYPGNSGSPMYDPETGKVLGVINKVFIKESKETVLEKPSGITYAIPVKYVKALLKKKGIKFDY